jgi:hypothetical protein
MINRTRKKQTKINGDKENNLTVLETKNSNKRKMYSFGMSCKNDSHMKEYIAQYLQ